MKKVKFILPVLAIVFAVAGVFATGNSASTVLDEPVTADHVAGLNDCTQDGTCTNEITGPACQLPSQDFTFKIIQAGQPVTCSSDAKGTFEL